MTTYECFVTSCTDFATTIDLQSIISQLSFITVVATLIFYLSYDHLKHALNRLAYGGHPKQ